VDGFQFVSSIVASLAWPVAVVVIVIVLRKSIAGVLDGPVKSLKVGPGGVELEKWDRVATEVRGEVGAPPTEGEAVGPVRVTEAGPPPLPEPAFGLREELQTVAEAAPRAAVVEAFGRVEGQLRSMVGRVDANASLKMGGRALARVGLEQSVINEETFNAIDGLSVMRNLAAHGTDDLDPARALEYLDLADAVLYAMRNTPRP
jgi:hypothetical protein